MTVTSNIHTGIVAWTNHSFALNEVCSNASNAYRCITAGSSTAAPTGTGSSINNGGAAVFKWLSTLGASDYSTIDAWVTSIPGTALTQPYVGLIWNNGVINRGSPVSCTGHTTDAVNTITLKCAVGESFADNPSSATNPLIPSASYGVQIARTGNYGYNIIFQEAYCTLDGLQVVRDPAGIHQNASLGLGQAGTGVTTVSRTIVRGTNFEQTNNGILGSGGSTDTNFINCLFIDESPAGQGSPIWNGQNNSCSFTNCTIVVLNSQAGFDAIHRNYSGVTTVTNCAIFGWGGIGNTNLTSGVARSNLVDWASYPSGWTDTGTLFSKTAANQFVGVGTDFKLKAGADALNAGFTDTTHIPSATDVYGTARPQGAAWDIGPHELVSAAAAYRARVVRWG